MKIRLRELASVLCAAATIGLACPSVLGLDGHTLLELPLDGSLIGLQGENPTTATGITFEQGIHNQGARFPTGNQLFYLSANNIDATIGTFECWIKPAWNGNDGVTHHILTWGGGGGMVIAKDAANNLRIILNRFSVGGQSEVGVALNINSWIANEWHYIAFTWSNSPKELKLYVDGVLRSSVSHAINLPVVSTSTFQIGGDGGINASLAVLDELQISDVARSAAEILARYNLTQGLFPAPGQQTAYAGNGRVTLNWLAFNPPPTGFDHFNIYRSTSPFLSIAGMTPIAAVSNGLANSYVDSTAPNGVSQHYAVTAVANNGAEQSAIASVGPRTPRDETDLQVVSISRLPRYPRYAPTYTTTTVTEPNGYGPYVFSAATGLGSGQTDSTQRWPNLGDPVTYRASIRNSGTNAVSGTYVVTWTVDGATVASPMTPLNLAPDQLQTLDLVWPWDGLVHEVGIQISIADAHPANNQLAISTKSVGFLSYIDRTFLENFREDTPLFPSAATPDYIDWLNRHMARFNEMFAAAGTPKRVHFDLLEVIGDYNPDPNVPLINFAVFPFRYHFDEESYRVVSGYYRAEEDIDYGLLHEMGHQLGLIDLYQLDLAPESNLVSGLGYYDAPACLMRGTSPFLSTHSAAAMTHWQDTAHGYFGQYLYAIPTQVRMRFLRTSGQPLSGATVSVYQKCERPGQGTIISNQIKFQGLTDADGLFELPNVPINPALVPPAFNGDVLAANPFGYVAVVGSNGVLHFKVELDGYSDYAWLDISECNVAYYSGQTAVATFDRHLRLGGPILCCAPDDLAESNAASWSAGAQGGSASASDDTTRVHDGVSSVRFNTDGGFDTSMRFPADRLIRWNLTNLQSIRFWCYAENPNIGFQSDTPWIRLGSPAGYFELRSSSTLLNNARNQWFEFVVPFAGNAEWYRTDFGSPDLSNIQYIELHFDTWGYGFTVWIDGLRLNPTPVGLTGDLNCDGVVSTADIGRFVARLLDPANADYCTIDPGDANHDGAVNAGDIQAFVAALY